MDPAKLNKRIEIHTEGDDQDGLGGTGEEGGLFCKAWAAIWPVNAKETRENMREEMNVSHQIRIYYRAGITSAMFIKYGTRIFDIKAIINPNESNRFLDMVCNERL